MTSRRLLKLALNTAMESQVDVSCGNSPDSCVDSSEGRLEKTSREGNIHASASTVQNANQLNFSDDSDYEYFDDSEADRDYNPLVDKESSSEDECQEDIKRYVVVPQTPLTSKFCKVTPTATDPDVMQSASSNSTAGQTPELSVTTTPTSTSVSTTPGSSVEILSPVKKCKRKRNESSWKRNVLKVARNSGKEYQSHSKKPEKRVRGERKMKPPCKETCRLKCSKKITEEERNSLFDSYWNLGAFSV